MGLVLVAPGVTPERSLAQLHAKFGQWIAPSLTGGFTEKAVKLEGVLNHEAAGRARHCRLLKSSNTRMPHPLSVLPCSQPIS
jgi:hypothetical protein